MEKSVTEDSPDTTETTAAEIMYSAEVHHSNGTYTLTITNRLRDEVEVYEVPKKAVEKLPFYLGMLRNKLS
ncbi:hypothetical protein ACWGJ2_03105 [Streptomyces sp. NPDC054796]